MSKQEKNRIFWGLQVGRGVAALLVVFYHATLGGGYFYGGVPFSGFWEFGFIGVDFFFVLSGFIIFWVQSAKSASRGSPRVYLIKRVIRIYAPYLPISLFLLWAYYFFSGSITVPRDIGLITSLLLLPTPPLEPVLTVAWTLLHEVLFYFVFLVFFISRKGFILFSLIWGGMIILGNTLFSPNNDLVRFFLSPYNIEFILGVLSALLVRRSKISIKFLWIGLALIILFILNKDIFSGELPEPSSSMFLVGRLLLGVGFMLIVLGICALESRVEYPRFLVYLGAASYSLYLVHNPVISVANRLSRYYAESFGLLPPEFFFLFALCCSLLAGLLYYRLWESPVVTWVYKKINSKNRSGDLGLKIRSGDI